MLKFGNHKLNDDVAIFSMGPARCCPSLELGLCNITVNGIAHCYARKAENFRPKVLEYRTRAGNYWLETTKEKLLEEFLKKIKTRRKETKFLRYNESGDFYSQECIEKLSHIAEGLKKEDIITFGFSARSDLDFSEAEFIVRGSDWEAKNGQCIVLRKEQQIPDRYILCPGGKKSCGGSKCIICMSDNKTNIAFRKH